MKYNIWRLFGAIMAAMLIAVAGFANAPNNAVNAPNTATAIAQNTTDTIITSMDVVQNDIATALTATTTEGGALVGAELATVASLGGKENLIIAINNTGAGAQKTWTSQAACTKTEASYDVICHTAAAVNHATSPANGATLCEEAYDVICEMAPANAAATLTG